MRPSMTVPLYHPSHRFIVANEVCIRQVTVDQTLFMRRSHETHPTVSVGSRLEKALVTPDLIFNKLATSHVAAHVVLVLSTSFVQHDLIPF